MYNKFLFLFEVQITLRLCNQYFRYYLFQNIECTQILKENITQSHFLQGKTANFTIFSCSLLTRIFMQLRVQCRYNFCVLFISCNILTSMCTYFPVPSIVFNDSEIFLCQTGLSFTCSCSVVIDIEVKQSHKIFPFYI